MHRKPWPCVRQTIGLSVFFMQAVDMRSEFVVCTNDLCAIIMFRTRHTADCVEFSMTACVVNQSDWQETRTTFTFSRVICIAIRRSIFILLNLHYCRHTKILQIILAMSLSDIGWCPKFKKPCKKSEH
jgi:hypothetical protein